MISILMPLYNGVEYLPDSVNSIIDQTFAYWELLIGINGYKANSNLYKVVKKLENRDERIKVYDLHMCKGKSNTLNKLVEYSSFDWISLIDVDDKWHMNKLKKQIPFTDDYDVIGTLCQYFGNKKGKPKLPTKDLSSFNFLQYNPIINSSSLIKKDLAYWEDISGCIDYELWLRLWKENKKFYNVDEILTYHRLHKNSYFNSTKKQKASLNQLLNKYRNM